MNDSDPPCDCVLQVVRNGEHETMLFTCTEREYQFLAWIAERIESLKLTKVSDGRTS